MKLSRMLSRGVVVAAIVLQGVAVAGAPTFIEPGRGVGAFDLGDTLRTVKRNMGDVDPDRVLKRGDTVLVVYEKSGLAFVSDSTKIVAGIVVTTRNLVVVGTSIGVGSTARDVKRLFGDGGKAPGVLSFPMRGVRFAIDQETQTVREITVFSRRGT